MIGVKRQCDNIFDTDTSYNQYSCITGYNQQRLFLYTIADILQSVKQKFYVLLGDVIHSRRITDRDDFQRRIEKTCQIVNTLYSGDTYADFKILKGIDEIGGVLTSMSKTYEIITTILEEIYPNLMRFVLVFDYIDTAVATRDITKMDGPAFHKASDMIYKLKGSKLVCDISANDKMIDTIIAGQINSILLMKINWSVRQHQVVKEYERTMNQSKVAENFGMTQQAVSKILNRSMWREIKQIEENLSFVLHKYQQMQENRK